MSIFKFWNVHYPLNAATEDVIGGITADDDEKVDEGDGKGEEEEIIEEDEEKEEDEEGEKKEDDEPVLTRVELKEITSKFPNFFKEFPDLKHAFFREQQFTELFPTVEDARRAVDAQNAYEEITSAVVDGDAGKFISELESESKEGLKKFVAGFMPALRENNRELYLDTVTPLVQMFVKNVYKHGVDEKDENVQKAAKVVHKILFGGSYDDIEKDIKSLIDRDRPRTDDKKDEHDKNNHLQAKYSALYKETSDLCYTKLDEEIGKGLADLDKTKAGLKRMLVKDIRERVLGDMEKDTNYLGRMEQLWKREQRGGFNGTHKSSILTVFLGKAKTLVAKHRAEARREALGKEESKERDANRLTGDRSSRGSKTFNKEEAKKAPTTRAIFD